MGKYLITSSESKNIRITDDREAAKLLTDNEEEEQEEEEGGDVDVEEDEEVEEEKEQVKEESSTLGKDSLRILCDEGGRWNINNIKDKKKEKNLRRHRGPAADAVAAADAAGRLTTKTITTTIIIIIIIITTTIINIYKKLAALIKSFKSFLILYLLIAMTLISLTIASPTPPSLNNYNNINNNNNNNNNDNNEEQLSSSYDIEDDNYLENMEDFENENRDIIDSQELDIIRKSIMQDLGLKKIPDPSKANVSQTEYEKAHREYLKRVELSNGQDQRTRRKLHVYYPADKVFDYDSLSNSRRNSSSSSTSSSSSSRSSSSSSSPNSIYFPVQIPSENHAVDHAALRILINGYEENELRDEIFVTVSIYQKTKLSRRLISRQRVSVGRYSPRWAEFDSTEAVASWVHDGMENLGFEIEVEEEEEEEEEEVEEKDEEEEETKNNRGSTARRRNIKNDKKSSSPSLSAALNVFTISSAENNFGLRNRRATPDQLMSLHRGRRTECRGQNKKCCRHEMTVIFKDLKGFEFIIQPKDFDAGYCKGRCPPRYNPAHHHALLQSLIWKEDRKKAPRPCCAPSKLTELEILYFDENDATKLKVSNWKNMKVLECACS